jgi:glycosyltransferase involved in cell wall biosynthesis
MKILYSCLSKSWGGMEMFTITAVKQLLKKGIKVELVCIAESRIHIEASSAGLIIYPIKVLGYLHPFSTLKMISILRRGNYDLIHTQSSKDIWLLVPALIFIKNKIPLILTKQVGSFIIKRDFLHRFLYNRVTYALAISRVIQKNLAETTPLKEDKILLLHNGIDLNKFDIKKTEGEKIRKEFEIKDNEIVIGMLARFSPGKGHKEFLYATNKLNRRFKNLKFLIVGEASRGEDDYANKIRKISAEYGSDNVIFTGYRSDTADVLAAMDIFVFPSNSEAFGIALVEAMAMGKPSVCSDSDGVLDIAIDGITSLLFKTKDGNDLTDKITILIKSPEKRKNLAAAARERVTNNFDIDILTDRVIEIYNKAIGINYGN